ncbi:hypothetical protein LJC14_06170 [Treponema sp. OttesenSCG-928-L16]|nr:hypothetical protein [Treponema sp. OttesenSCG-928-L16]
MKKNTPWAFVFILVLFLAFSCAQLFSPAKGDGTLAITLGGDSSRASLGEIPAEDLPEFSSVRISVKSGGSEIFAQTFSGGESKYQVSVLSGGPYRVEVVGTLKHPGEPLDLAFVRSLGGARDGVMVSASEGNTVSINMRLWESAILVPDYSNNFTQIYPAMVFSNFVNNTSFFSSPFISCFENSRFAFDPYGRLFVMGQGDSDYSILRYTSSSTAAEIHNDGSLYDERSGGLAYDSAAGRLYFVSYNDVYFINSDVKSDNINPTRLGQIKDTLDIIIDDFPCVAADGNGHIYVAGTDRSPQEYGFFKLKVTEEGQGTTVSLAGSPVYFDQIPYLAFLINSDDPTFEGDLFYLDLYSITDMKVSNGTLYILVCGEQEEPGSNLGEGAVIAIPVDSFTVDPESVIGNRARKTWSATTAPANGDTGPFLGPRRFAGFGPDKLYIYDAGSWTPDEETYPIRVERIVEFNTRTKKIVNSGIFILP